MKKLVLAVAALCMGILACSKDDDNDGSQQQQETSAKMIQGEWNLDRAHKVMYENGVKVDEDIESWQESLSFTEAHYTIVEGTTDTTAQGPYILSSDSLLLYGPDTLRYGLILLTDSELNLALTERYSSDTTLYRDETTYFYAR